MVSKGEMKPGREMDVLVAEKVMGWSPERIKESDFYIDEAGRTRHDLPSYSTDIKAAWDIVEKMRLLTPDGVLKDSYFTITAFPNAEHGYSYEAGWMYYDLTQCEGRGMTAPEAICKAALKACGVEV